MISFTKTIFVGFAIIFLTTLGTALAESNLYENQTYGFSIQIPTGLNYEDKEFSPGSPLVALGEYDQEIQNYDSIFLVALVEQYDWTEDTDKKQLGVEISRRAVMHDGFSLINATVTSIDEKKAFQMIYSYGDSPITVLETEIFDGESVWWIYSHVAGGTSEWEQNEDVIKASVQSFDLIQ